MTDMKFDFNSITGQKDVDQTRALRLVLAVVEDDLVQLMAVAEEVARDPRGPDIAVWELAVGMAGTVALQWVGPTNKNTVAEGIRAVLLKNPGEGVQHG